MKLFTMKKLLFAMLLLCMAFGQRVHAQEATTWQDDYQYKLDKDNKQMVLVTL